MLQGIRIDSYRNNASITAFNDNYRGYLKREAKGVVDILSMGVSKYGIQILVAVIIIMILVLGYLVMS